MFFEKNTKELTIMNKKELATVTAVAASVDTAGELLMLLQFTQTQRTVLPFQQLLPRYKRQPLRLKMPQVQRPRL